jgi:diguanylate cyclase (GGDEF)-like protein
VDALLDHLGAMTLTRDRDAIDQRLLAAQIDLLPAVQEAWLWRVLVAAVEGGDPATADGAAPLWRCGVHQRRGEAAQLTGPDTEALQPLADLPQHTASLQAGAPQQWQAGAVFHVLLPLGSGPETDGVLELRSDVALDTASLRLAQGLAHVHRNVLGLLEYSERDTLTRLLNRKSFDETFLKATALEAARLYGPDALDAPGDAERRRPAERRHWLGVVDIDHFKQVNDRFGHLMGDEVLVAMGRIMRHSLRHDDRLYRFGGEEFVVLLTAPDDATAGAVLDRLRHNIERALFPAAGHVTASIGYSDVRPGDTPQAAFDRADRAVYHAKDSGRNRVCSFAALVADGSQVAHPGVGEVELF